MHVEQNYSDWQCESMLVVATTENGLIIKKAVKDHHHHLLGTNRENFPPEITYPQEEFWNGECK